GPPPAKKLPPCPASFGKTQTPPRHGGRATPASSKILTAGPTVPASSRRKFQTWKPHDPVRFCPDDFGLRRLPTDTVGATCQFALLVDGAGTGSSFIEFPRTALLRFFQLHRHRSQAPRCVRLRKSIEERPVFPAPWGRRELASRGFGR